MGALLADSEDSHRPLGPELRFEGSHELHMLINLDLKMHFSLLADGDSGRLVKGDLLLNFWAAREHSAAALRRSENMQRARAQRRLAALLREADVLSRIPAPLPLAAAMLDAEIARARAAAEPIDAASPIDAGNLADRTELNSLFNSVDLTELAKGAEHANRHDTSDLAEPPDRTDLKDAFSQPVDPLVDIPRPTWGVPPPTPGATDTGSAAQAEAPDASLRADAAVTASDAQVTFTEAEDPGDSRALRASLDDTFSSRSCATSSPVKRTAGTKDSSSLNRPKALAVADAAIGKSASASGANLETTRASRERVLSEAAASGAVTLQRTKPCGEGRSPANSGSVSSAQACDDDGSPVLSGELVAKGVSSVDPVSAPCDTADDSVDVPGRGSCKKKGPHDVSVDSNSGVTDGRLAQAEATSGELLHASVLSARVTTPASASALGSSEVDDGSRASPGVRAVPALGIQTVSNQEPPCGLAPVASPTFSSASAFTVSPVFAPASSPTRPAVPSPSSLGPLKMGLSLAATSSASGSNGSSVESTSQGVTMSSFSHVTTPSALPRTAGSPPVAHGSASGSLASGASSSPVLPGPVSSPLPLAPTSPLAPGASSSTLAPGSMSLSSGGARKRIRIMVPVDKYPEYNFVGRLLGPRGATLKKLERETGCRIMIRGRGSVRKDKEADVRGKPGWEHVFEDPLHVVIEVTDAPDEQYAMRVLTRAKESVALLLVPVPEEKDSLKRQQLRELAILNGTFRASDSSMAQAAAQAAVVHAAAQVQAHAAAVGVGHGTHSAHVHHSLSHAGLGLVDSPASGPSLGASGLSLPSPHGGLSLGPSSAVVGAPPGSTVLTGGSLGTGLKRANSVGHGSNSSRAAPVSPLVRASPRASGSGSNVANGGAISWSTGKAGPRVRVPSLDIEAMSESFLASPPVLGSSAIPVPSPTIVDPEMYPFPPTPSVVSGDAASGAAYSSPIWSPRLSPPSAPPPIPPMPAPLHQSQPQFSLGQFGSSHKPPTSQPQQSPTSPALQTPSLPNHQQHLRERYIERRQQHERHAVTSANEPHLGVPSPGYPQYQQQQVPQQGKRRPHASPRDRQSPSQPSFHHQLQQSDHHIQQSVHQSQTLPLQQQQRLQDYNAQSRHEEDHSTLQLLQCSPLRHQRPMQTPIHMPHFSSGRDMQGGGNDALSGQLQHHRSAPDLSPSLELQVRGRYTPFGPGGSSTHLSLGEDGSLFGSPGVPFRSLPRTAGTSSETYGGPSKHPGDGGAVSAAPSLSHQLERLDIGLPEGLFSSHDEATHPASERDTLRVLDAGSAKESIGEGGSPFSHLFPAGLDTNASSETQQTSDTSSIRTGR